MTAEAVLLSVLVGVAVFSAALCTWAMVLMRRWLAPRERVVEMRPLNPAQVEAVTAKWRLGTAAIRIVDSVDRDPITNLRDFNVVMSIARAEQGAVDMLDVPITKSEIAAIQVDARDLLGAPLRLLKV